MATPPSSGDTEGVDEREDQVPEAGPGVLLGDVIKKYIDKLNPKLIQDADTENNLRPASYSLRLGKNYYQDGSYGILTDDNPVIIIRPHGMVVVSTYEKLHVPRYLIGRWNLRVSLVYTGLLWAGGPQVDPGFSGFLFCPLYNLSNTEVALKLKEHIFTIDFEKTTSYNEEVAKDHPYLKFKGTKHKLDDYIPSYDLKSSVGELKKQVEASEKRVTKRVDDLQSTVLIGLSIVFAGLTIVATLPSIPGAHLTLSIDLLTGFYVSLSLSSIILSLFAIKRTKRPDKSESIFSKLAKLETLQRAGSITKEESDKKKKKLLRKLG